ncbi:MAG: hypothetical protein QW818_02445 [Candidatus Aenigmatarchaeota archaeon]
MTTRITLVYDKLITEISALFPQKRRLLDPYNLTQNPERILADGWGLRKGSVDLALREFNTITDAHNFTFILTSELVRSETQINLVDDVVKSLAEDLFLFRERIYRYDELGITQDVTQIDMGSASGIEEIISGNGRFLTLSVEFTVHITESFM